MSCTEELRKHNNAEKQRQRRAKQQAEARQKEEQAVLVLSERDSALAALDNVSTQLSSAKIELNSLSEELQRTKIELNSVSEELQQTKSAYERATQELHFTKIELNSLSEELQRTKSGLVGVLKELQQTRSDYERAIQQLELGNAPEILRIKSERDSHLVQLRSALSTQHHLREALRDADIQYQQLQHKLSSEIAEQQALVTKWATSYTEQQERHDRRMLEQQERHDRKLFDLEDRHDRRMLKFEDRYRDELLALQEHHRQEFEAQYQRVSCKYRTSLSECKERLRNAEQDKEKYAAEMILAAQEEAQKDHKRMLKREQLRYAITGGWRW